MAESDPLGELRRALATLERMGEVTDVPAVAMALRHAVYYCHLAAGFLGDEGLAPEVDADQAERGA